MCGVSMGDRWPSCPFFVRTSSGKRFRRLHTLYVRCDHKLARGERVAGDHSMSVPVEPVDSEARSPLSTEAAAQIRATATLSKKK